jgi:alpha-N-arabinofuranosidase
MAQLVNVLGPIRTEPDGPAWRQTTFHPFAHTARWASGTVLRTVIESPAVDTRRHGTVPAIDGVVVHDLDHVTVLAVNRTRDQPVRVRVDLSALGDVVVTEAVSIHDDDPAASNTAGEPDRVMPRVVPGLRGSSGPFDVELPPTSWLAVRLRKERRDQTPLERHSRERRAVT